MLKCLRKILEMRGSAGFACDNKGYNVRRWNEKNGQQNMLIIRDDS